MYLFEADTALVGPARVLSGIDGELPPEVPVCDGCGQPSPCAAATHAYGRELAADFARSYSGL
ncbi:hypothetical protein [Catellatospora vulcania]|uniref:hypothetical protein n=1 Tax=Catellatospora vulcania TaxID=1460450 RepID=UPI0012D3B2BB|nr:hypothetical protein [Catellatospora vulcania]